MVFCSKCGSENKDSNEKCEKCGEFLLKPEFFEFKKIEEFDKIFTEENFNALTEITIEAYAMVIKNIIHVGHINLEKILKKNNISLEQLPILDKVAIITQSYSKILPKSQGEALGDYGYNLIEIDDRLMYTSQQITTLIHELSHHIFSEIFEQLLMYVWESNKSDAIEAFTWFTLMKSPKNQIINEYCAHSCEGRFTPWGYQNYGSFINIRNKFFNPETDRELIEELSIIGNTIASDVIFILETFITPQFREEIKEQFKKDYPVQQYNDNVTLETRKQISNEEKIEFIIKVLCDGFQDAQNKNINEILEWHKNRFTYNNSH